MYQLPVSKTCFKCAQRLITPKRKVVTSTAKDIEKLRFEETSVQMITCRCGIQYWSAS